MDVLITAGQLAERMSDGRRTVVLDVRWKLGSDTGHEDYLAGHVPGAVYVHLETELAAPGAAERGRHPLPDAEVFTAAVQRWGIQPGDTVVAYDAVGGSSAARAWWMLRDAGLERVMLLDGGLAAWVEAGGTLEAGAVDPEPGSWIPRPGGWPVLDIDGAAAFPATGVLLDARAGERYRGEIEPFDARPGHVPGAVSAPTSENLDAAGCFLDAGALRERFAHLGATGDTPVAVYCGSGVTAAHQIAALAIAGIDAALYPGSFSQYAADLDRPVATGAGS